MEHLAGAVRIEGFCFNVDRVFQDFVCVALRKAIADGGSVELRAHGIHLDRRDGRWNGLARRREELNGEPPGGAMQADNEGLDREGNPRIVKELYTGTFEEALEFVQAGRTLGFGFLVRNCREPDAGSTGGAEGFDVILYEDIPLSVDDEDSPEAPLSSTGSRRRLKPES
ncbi:hypothetical protein ABIA33_001343 [Streptacidiphilus sp. MAP12-16]|uniref:hypothetical protein n=1 Tax=Streptacidiphilus sp. MAP12-16 TaxID=3156300 RepID=UPI00351681C8